MECVRAAVRGGCAEGVTRVRLPLNLQDALREAGRHVVRLRVRSGAQVLGKDLRSLRKRPLPRASCTGCCRQLRREGLSGGHLPDF